MAKPVSQSRTMWVKKGTVVDGKKVKKGYVAQYGKPEKRVTNRVRLEVDTPKRGEKGDVVRLKKGRYVTKKKKPSAAGRGAAGRGSSSGSGKASKPASSGSRVTNTTASRIGGYTPGTRLAGSGSDGVNASTSSGSARTSDYVHDSFSSYWMQPRRQGSPSGNKYMTGNKPSNRPSRGERSKLHKDKKGNYRWVKVI